MRQEIRNIDKDQPILNIEPMVDVMARFSVRRRFGVTLLSMFAGLALILAAIGVYGVVSNSVTQRSQEIAVRMALGARPSDLTRLLVKQSMLLVFIGLAIGLAASFALVHLIKTMLFGISATDPTAMASAAVLLLVIGLIASYFPVRRAVKQDPMRALRNE